MSKQKIEAWKDLSLVPGEVVLPLIAKRCAKSWKEIWPTCIPGGTFCGPSKIRIKNHFPIEPAFAMTVDKAQGRTMSKVILALSSQSFAPCQMDCASIYVALSRVKHRNDIRLLLSGKNVAEQRDSLRYISALRRNPSIAAFFAGFGEGRANLGWTRRKWNSILALQHMH